jgi:hypothetical protein
MVAAAASSPGETIANLALAAGQFLLALNR